MHNYRDKVLVKHAKSNKFKNNNSKQNVLSNWFSENEYKIYHTVTNHTVTSILEEFAQLFVL